MSGDPTAFDIDFDPTVQRMRGVAVHGNTPFDVPFVSQITDDLWQGGCQTGLVLPPAVDHLVSLYPWERYTVTHELASETYVRMYDAVGDSGPGLDQALAVAQWVKACRKTGTVLVHCQAGLNRSSLIAGLALRFMGYSGEQAVTLLRSKRSDAVLCNPDFEALVLTAELA